MFKNGLTGLARLPLRARVKLMCGRWRLQENSSKSLRAFKNHRLVPHFTRVMTLNARRASLTRKSSIRPWLLLRVSSALDPPPPKCVRCISLTFVTSFPMFHPLAPRLLLPRRLLPPHLGSFLSARMVAATAGRGGAVLAWIALGCQLCW